MKGVNLHLDRMIHWSDIKFVLTVHGLFLSHARDRSMHAVLTISHMILEGL
jgi:hypothetical protein